MTNEINFLRPKSALTREIQRPSLLRIALVFITSFIVIFTILNFQILMNKMEVWINSRTDRDEIMETQILQAKYSNPSFIQPQSKKEDNNIYIPEINVKAPIVLGTSGDSNQLLAELESGVVLYPGSSFNEQAVVLGHSSSHNPLNKYGNVFSALEDLKINDLIQVNHAGQEYYYSVAQKKTGSVFTLANSDIQGDLVLSSCWPVGTDRGRILIIANKL